MFHVAICLALAAPVTGSGDAAARHLNTLQGTWVGVSSEQEGRNIPEADARAVILIFHQNHLTVRSGDEVLMHALVKLPGGSSPQALDVTPTDGVNRGKTLLAIDEVKGDTLRLCIADVGRPRPTEFSAREGTGISLYVLKRERP